MVRTLHSGISRGTETLVFRGRVPSDQYAGDARAVPGRRVPRAGEVRLPQRRRRRAGPAAARRAAPCSASTRTRAPTSCRPAAVVPVPDDVPAARAVLAGTVETAVNALWDAAPLVGDRVAVVGAGMVGCCVARLLAGLPGAQVTLVDVDPAGPVSRHPRGRRSRCLTTRPATAISSCTPAPRRPGCSARSTCSPRRAR